MENNQISCLAFQLRSSVKNKPNILTLSTPTLAYLLLSFDSIEEQSTSFHVKQPHNFKAELLRDLQYISNYFQQAKSLKLYSDNYTEDTELIDITKFRNLIFIEFSKFNVNTVKGIQVLRSQLQKLVCQKTLNTLDDILNNCGADKSQASCWSELKEASFVSNSILELDQSLECAPWLHTLDLSHNEITNIEAVSCLGNLKTLNVSYNKLEAVPQFKGQICSRLQNVVLKNNFIEDVTGLRSLNNVCVLDLSNNCLIDHKSLLTVSHLATLQWLNLRSNPLSFHPNHRNRTASYLHVNTASTHFVLNHVALSKNEKRLVGSYYPLQSKNNSLANDSLNMATDRVRKVRQVVIEEEASSRESTVLVRPPTPRQYLETKKQIEDLHEKFGESWLNSQSGLLDVLGLESFSLPLSTSPYEADFTIYSGDFDKAAQAESTPLNTSDILNEEYDKHDATPDTSLDEPDVEGEESIYLATIKTETDPIFIVIGPTHLSERECSTGSEREKWHLDSILSCEIVDESATTVQLDFDTMRKDKKQRIYVFEEEIDAFVGLIKNKINSRTPKKEDDIKFQCMKCSVVFKKIKNGSMLGEAVVQCPSCDSTLVVEAE
jgi:hypothetical protein